MLRGSARSARLSSDWRNAERFVRFALDVSLSKTSASWWPRCAYAPRFDDRKAPEQAIPHFFDSFDDSLALRILRASMKPYQYNACGGMRTSKDQLTKISIFGHQNAPGTQGLRDHDFVQRTLCSFRNRTHVMTCGAKRVDDRPRATLVGEKFHDQRLLAFAESESRTISSWATLAAP
jgi:hypothetical protein